jgi:hypothetical protein
MLERYLLSLNLPEGTRAASRYEGRRVLSRTPGRYRCADKTTTNDEPPSPRIRRFVVYV